jgi:glycosyltransferase involved in cell wall biosynthesis
VNILFLTMQYPPVQNGGIGWYVGTLAPKLASRGHGVHVLSCVRGQARSDSILQGVHVHRRDWRNIRGLWRIGKYFGLPMTIAHLQAGISAFLEARNLEVHFDVIEFPDWHAEAWMFACRRRTALVGHIHAAIPHIQNKSMQTFGKARDVFWAGQLDRFALHRAHLVTSPSKVALDGIKEIGWLRDRSVTILPHGIDEGEWSGAPTAATTRPVVLFVGRIEPVKAPEILVKAMGIIRTRIPDAEAVFVGASNGEKDGRPYGEWIRQLAADVGGCRFVGNIERKDLLQFYGACRVVAVPSWFETYGLAALEAMATRRPVIVTNTTGIAEFLEKTGAGVRVPPGDPVALADALLPFLKSAEHAEAVGAQAFEAVVKHANLHMITEKREKLYQRAIEVSRATA